MIERATKPMTGERAYRVLTAERADLSPEDLEKRAELVARFNAIRDDRVLLAQLLLTLTEEEKDLINDYRD